MEKARRIEVTINGQHHYFVSDEGEEYIRGLADYLNEKISEVSRSNIGNIMLNDKKYIVAAMSILDDYYKILSKYEELRNNKDASNAAADNLQKAAANYESKLMSANNEHDKRIAALKNEYAEKINTLKNEYRNEHTEKMSALQKENAKLKEKLESIEYELNYVQNMYKEQKQDYEQLLEKATEPDA